MTEASAPFDPSVAASPFPAPPVSKAAVLAFNLMLEAELGRLVEDFEANHLDVVVLKGIPLTLRLFGSLDARWMIDNDLLVRRRDAERAAALLAARGYVSIDSRTVGAQLAIDYQYRLQRRLEGGGFLAAELHWSPFSQLLFPVEENLLWRHVEPFQWNGRTVRVFDRALTLVHLAAHFVHSDFAIPQILRDIATAWDRWFTKEPPDEALALARDVGLIHALDYALRSAADLGWLQGATPAIGSRRADRLRRLLPAAKLWTPRPVPDYERWLLSMLLAEPRRVPRWVWYAMFPPLENLAAIEGTTASSALRWKYLMRPFRAVGRAFTRRSETIVRR